MIVNVGAGGGDPLKYLLASYWRAGGLGRLLPMGTSDVAATRRDVGSLQARYPAER
jgi:hypothetical protein